MLTQAVKTVLITGGGSGMGRASALALAARGLEVLAADLDPERARETARLVEEAGGRARSYQVDVSSSASAADLFDLALAHAGRLDMLVHTAAILGETASLQDISDQAWRRMMAVNLDGAFFCCRQALKVMIPQGGGRIVLFSSVAALTPTPGAAAYSAAKGGVNMLARTLAVEAARHNVRVNVIAPGYVETPMLTGLPEGFSEYIIKKTPLKRLGRPEEVAALAAFLSTDEADFITGQVLSPNGGLVV